MGLRGGEEGREGGLGEGKGEAGSREDGRLRKGHGFGSEVGRGNRSLLLGGESRRLESQQQTRGTYSRTAGDEISRQLGSNRLTVLDVERWDGEGGGRRKEGGGLGFRV